MRLWLTWLTWLVGVQGLIVPEREASAQSRADKHFYRRKGIKHAAETLVAYHSIKGAKGLSLFVTVVPSMHASRDNGRTRRPAFCRGGHLRQRVCTDRNASAELSAIAGAQCFAIAGAQRIADRAR